MLDSEPADGAAVTDTRRFVIWLWLLSGPIAALVLIAVPYPVLVWFFIATVFLETGHSLSPIALAWSNKGFRGVMRSHPWWYYALPSAVFTVCVAIGLVTQFGYTSYIPGPGRYQVITDWRNPFPVLTWVYSAFNLYHFGMQNFGVLSMVRRGSRVIDITICLVATVLVAVVLKRTLHYEWMALAILGLVSLNHWVVDLGLSARASSHSWIFLGGVLLAGGVGFVWMYPDGQMIRMIPAIICARLGLGFVHFLYSRWVWQLSNPQVRATIGKELFA